MRDRVAQRCGSCLVAVALALGVAGCSDKTALKVVVTSPLGVPSEADQLDFAVVGDSSGQMARERFELTAAFPHSLSVRPGSSTSEGITVTVTARKRAMPTDTEGVLVVRRVVRDRFADGEDRTITIDLPRTCVGVSCMDGVDCVDGRCGMGCAGDGECDDRDPCNGVERCEAGRCASPGMADCDDRVACTVDACAGRACSHTPNDAMCAAGDTCDVALGCGGRPCSGDAECDDGMFCNGTETCVSAHCRAGPEPDCADADDCTTDSCGGAAPGACRHLTRDTDGDGHGSAACAVAGGVPNDDCDDGDATVAPGEPELCNARDDDCDMACDDGFACCRASTAACTTTCGTAGMQVCDTACAFGACNPPAETCNGMDDDCDGACDNGVGCCSGTIGTCTTSCGSAGVRDCGIDCVPGPCVAPAETCNGLDDDCNAVVDDGFPCAAGSTMPCPTTCMSTGTRTCAADCTMGACVPPVELCGNGRDDNCDTAVDEGCVVGCTGTCTVAAPIALPGGRFTATLAPDAFSGTCGGAGGSEALFTFTLTSDSDVFITTHGSSIDTVLYVRQCMCAGMEVGCNDDADGLNTSVLRLPSLAGGTYTVFVDSRAAMSASISLDVYVSPTGAAGDRCGNPVRFTGAAATGNTCGLASDTGGACDFSSSLAGPDRVYYFVVTGAAHDVTFDTCTGCTDYNATIEVRRVCSATGGGDRVVCEDDTCRSSCAGGGPARQPRVLQRLTPGLYYVFVDGLGSACGNYDLRAPLL